MRNIHKPSTAANSFSCRKSRHSVFWVLAIAICGSGTVMAQSQGAPIEAVANETRVYFGSPVFLFDNNDAIAAGLNASNSISATDSINFWESAGGKYLETGAILQGAGKSVPAAGDGKVLFIQENTALKGRMPRAAGNFLALAHRDGFVSLYSSKDFLPKSLDKSEIMKGETIGSASADPRTGNAGYFLRVYDGTSKLWVNPALFIQGLDDRIPPKIKQIALVGSKGTITAENRINVMQTLPQGDYLLAANVVDPLYGKESISGLFRLKVVFDGQIVADRKLDSARITERGLAFFDLEAPSSKGVDEEGRLLLGKVFLPSGKHTLAFFAYDYSGNEASFTWKFIVQ